MSTVLVMSIMGMMMSVFDLLLPSMGMYHGRYLRIYVYGLSLYTLITKIRDQTYSHKQKAKAAISSNSKATKLSQRSQKVDQIMMMPIFDLGKH